MHLLNHTEPTSKSYEMVKLVSVPAIRTGGAGNE